MYRLFKIGRTSVHSHDDSEWVEKDHPRGQPGNPGQFVAKGSGTTSSSQTATSTKKPPPHYSHPIPQGHKWTKKFAEDLHKLASENNAYAIKKYMSNPKFKFSEKVKAYANQLLKHIEEENNKPKEESKQETKPEPKKEETEPLSVPKGLEQIGHNKMNGTKAYKVSRAATLHVKTNGEWGIYSSETYNLIDKGKGQASLNAVLGDMVNKEDLEGSKSETTKSELKLGKKPFEKSVAPPADMKLINNNGYLASYNTKKAELYLTVNGGWELYKKKPGGLLESQPVSTGFGSSSEEQKRLNEAFEALHPRDEHGHFIKKPGQEEPIKEQTKQEEKPIQTGNPITTSSAKPSASSALGGKIDLSKLKKVGEQKGSNPGGVYEDEDGTQYYVKKTQSAKHAANEKLAAALFSAAGGGQTLEYMEAKDDPKAVATKMVNLSTDNLSDLSSVAKKKAQKSFAVQAWLANWDAVGLSGDNIGVTNGEPIYLDFGGSLEYRAKGESKGDKFGYEADEWDTLRNPTKNAKSAELYGDMTEDQLKESAIQLGNAITSVNQIKDLINQVGGYNAVETQALANKLFNRRNDILERAKNNNATKVPFTFHSNPDQLNTELKKHSPKPTNEEKNALAMYTNGHYDDINKALRFGFHSSGKHPHAASIKGCTDYLNKCSIPEDVVVSRKVSNKYADFLKEMAYPEAEFVDFGFASTSADPTIWNGDLQMVVRIPKGSKAAAVQDYSSHKSEQEILIQRGSRFRVVSYDEKAKILYCELDQSHLINA